MLHTALVSVSPEGVVWHRRQNYRLTTSAFRPCARNIDRARLHGHSHADRMLASRYRLGSADRRRTSRPASFLQIRVCMPAGGRYSRAARQAGQDSSAAPMRACLLAAEASTHCQNPRVWELRQPPRGKSATGLSIRDKSRVLWCGGDPGGTRTPNTQFRRLMLYPLSYGAMRSNYTISPGDVQSLVGPQGFCYTGIALSRAVRHFQVSMRAAVSSRGGL
jgi:hypothetical protein